MTLNRLEVFVGRTVEDSRLGSLSQLGIPYHEPSRIARSESPHTDDVMWNDIDVPVRKLLDAKVRDLLLDHRQVLRPLIHKCVPVLMIPGDGVDDDQELRPP